MLIGKPVYQNSAGYFETFLYKLEEHDRFFQDQVLFQQTCVCFSIHLLNIFTSKFSPDYI